MHNTPINLLTLQPITSIAQAWLTDSGSLTKRLREYTHQQIEHCLFFNGLDENEKNWIRRMEWRYQGKTWVRCVITIPKNSLVDELKNIGTCSIGDILFADPTLRRSEFIFEKNNGMITRTSTFYFKEKPIQLTETFLPEFFEFVETHPKLACF